MYYALLATSIAVATLGGALKNSFSKSHLQTESDCMLFNAICSVFALVFVFALSPVWSLPSVYTLLLGGAYGVATALGQHFSTRALQTGPMAFSSLFSSFALVIPTLGGLLIWRESISPFQIIGLVLLCASFVLTANPKMDKGITGRWLLYCLLSFLSSGAVGLMQKFHQTSIYKDELDAFLITAFLVTAVCFLLLYGNSRQRQKIPLSFSLKSRVPLMAMVSGVGIGVCNKINLYLSGRMPGAVFFPLVNGGGVVCAVLVAILFFRERPRRPQMIGLALGVAAILLVSNLLGA